MSATLKDVAERAGVSRSAVSRAFTEGASVSAKTRAKVEKAAAELGYAPSALAQALTTGRTKLIGLVANNFHNPFFLQVFDLFTRGLQDRGLRPLLVNLTDETDPENSVRLLRQYSVDGVIVASSTLSPKFALAFRQAGLPVVHSFGRKTTRPDVHIVGIDNVACGEMAAKALLAKNYAKIGFLGGPEAATSTQDRLAGFRAALAGSPAGTPQVSFASAYSFEAGRAAMRAILDQDRLAQGYFCGDDVISLGALSALREAGINVPGRVGLIGLNDMEIAGWESFALTTIHQPIADIIDASIDLVIATINTPDLAPRTRSFDCHIIERNTLP